MNIYLFIFHMSDKNKRHKYITNARDYLQSINSFPFCSVHFFLLFLYSSIFTTHLSKHTHTHTQFGIRTFLFSLFFLYFGFRPSLSLSLSLFLFFQYIHINIHLFKARSVNCNNMSCSSIYIRIYFFLKKKI